MTVEIQDKDPINIDKKNSESKYLRLCYDYREIIFLKIAAKREKRRRKKNILKKNRISLYPAGNVLSAQKRAASDIYARAANVPR